VVKLKECKSPSLLPPNTGLKDTVREAASAFPNALNSTLVITELATELAELLLHN
jgi:hypothetical protein